MKPKLVVNNEASIIGEVGDDFLGRLYDQIIVADFKGKEEGLSDQEIRFVCIRQMIVLLVIIASNAMPPDELMQHVQEEIDEWTEE